MRVIDRLYQYIAHKNIVPYAFERNCGIANGYLKKQTRGKGSIGSEILEKIHLRHSDLSLIWLITGTGAMLNDTAYVISESGDESHRVQDHRAEYLTDERTVRLLREKIAILENSLADKEKIIRLIEDRLAK